MNNPQKQGDFIPHVFPCRITREKNGVVTDACQLDYDERNQLLLIDNHGNKQKVSFTYFCQKFADGCHYYCEDSGLIPMLLNRQELEGYLNENYGQKTIFFANSSNGSGIFTHKKGMVMNDGEMRGIPNNSTYVLHPMLALKTFAIEGGNDEVRKEISIAKCIFALIAGMITSCGYLYYREGGKR